LPKILISPVLIHAGYRETKMLRTALIAVLIAGSATGAMAIDGPKYDRKIEAAAKRIVAKKVGDIRGGFDIDANPVAIATGETALAGDSLKPDETPLVQVAMLDVSEPAVFQTPANYRSGRPEPIRKVRRITSFQYF
jgi:hypothetical protein